MWKPAYIEKIRFRGILLFTGTLSLFIQLAIVTYNAYTGFVRVDSLAEYFFRVLYGTFFTTLMGLMILYPDLVVIRWLNARYEWGKTLWKRAGLQLLFTLVIACGVSTAGTMGVNAIHPYEEDLSGVLVTNALIVSVINLLLVTGLEAWLFFRANRRARHRLEKMQNELAVIRFEVLKNQINPHFMFNSLNVLSGLIDQDTRKAQVFIEAFGQIYRYVLETIEKPVVTVEEELRFARSYMHLQQIRHGEHLQFEVDLPAASLPLLMPPLSLQVVLENALKHNMTGPMHPMVVRLSAGTEWMEVRNQLQPKTSAVTSTGIGQKNLVRRYAMVSDRLPEFRIENNQYVVKLPLIPCED